MVRALICLELILNSVNLNLVTFSDLFDSRQSIMSTMRIGKTCYECLRCRLDKVGREEKKFWIY
jgi:NADH:ubiquinone oxidoreductase subunit K